MAEDLDILNIEPPMLSDEERLCTARALINEGEFCAAADILSPAKPCLDKTLLMAEAAQKSGDFARAKVLYNEAAVKYRSPAAMLALNSLCLELSAKQRCQSVPHGPLADYSGREISFDRKGIPVSAKVYQEGGRYIFDIKLNVVQRELSQMKLAKPARALIQGIKQWQGVYTVFGGYELEVRIKCTSELTAHNSLVINILDDETADSVTGMLEKLGKKGKRSADIISKRRQTAATLGSSWHLKGLKYINIYEKDLTSVPHCKFIARHEFGHILGLDDMYAEKADGRAGVTRQYSDIEPFRIKGCSFNMIMCSKDAPVIFKDIEMALLAYRDDELQRYQPRHGKGSISSALI